MTSQATVVSRVNLHFAPARVGRAVIVYDRDNHTYTVSAPGFTSRVTRKFQTACDLAVGWA